MGRFYKNPHLAFLAKTMLPWPTALPCPWILQSPTQPLISPEGLIKDPSHYLSASLHSTRGTHLNKPGYSPEGQAIPRAVLLLPSLLQADQQNPASASPLKAWEHKCFWAAPWWEREIALSGLGVCGRNHHHLLTTFPRGISLTRSYLPPLYPGVRLMR